MPTHSANPNAGQNNTAMNVRATVVAATLVKGDRFVLARSADTLSAADSGPWNAATWDPATYAVACDAYETVFVTAKFTAAGAASVRVSPMFYDADSQLWMSLIEGGAIVQSEAIDGSGNQMAEVRVAGMRAVLFRITAVTGGPLTNFEIAVYRGTPRGVAVLG